MWFFGVNIPEPKVEEKPQIKFDPNCLECHGTGVYVGFLVKELCHTCGQRSIKETTDSR